VNELQLIRNQLTAERNRAAELAAAITAPSAGTGSAFRQACVDYLVFVLTRFEERDQMLADLLRARFAESDATRKALQDALARPGASRQALTKLEAALGGTSPAPPSGAQASEFAAYFDGPWRMRRDAIDSLQQAHLRVTDWRAVSFVDADSIVEERTRYSRVQSARGTNAA
jgi:hypothetical protein